MLFGFGHLVTVMSAIHEQVDPATVEARLKYLQRIPFPAARTDVGKGGRTYYSADDLMKLVTVLELIAGSMLPAQAAALVRERWDGIATGLARAWDARSNPIASVLMVAAPNTFDVDGGGAGHVDITSAEELAVWLKSRRDGDRGRGADGPRRLDRRVTVIDLVSVAIALDAALSPSNPELEMIAMERELGAWAGARRRVVRTGT